MAISPITVGVVEGYRLWSKTYDQPPNPLLALEERILSALLGDVRGKRVLDVGCGTGRWLAKLRQCHAGRVVGIDMSPEMLARAREKEGPGAELACARCDRLPLRNASADLIICSFVLSYVPDICLFAREAARVAAPGALLVISDFHPQAHARGWRRSFRWHQQEIEIQSFRRDLAEIKAAFEQAGFQPAHVVEPAFGEPERQIYEAAGKAELFDEAAKAGPAVFVCELRRAQAPVVWSDKRRPGRLAVVGARVALDARTATTADLEVKAGRIQRILRSSSGADAIDLAGYLVLPGLINAHDHLEFNLFPRLGRGPFGHSREWAEAIYRPAESPVREHRMVPKRTRLHWGGLKNLFSGVTTVCHHNPFEGETFGRFPVRVVERYGWAHSLAFDVDVSAAYKATPADAPFVIHLAEGTDGKSEAEIHELDRLGALGANTVIVHGVGLRERGHRLLRERGAALVWCPSSNLFTLGATIEAEQLQRYERLALGTDSALSGAGDLLDELRIARRLGASPERLYEMVATRAADVLRLRDGGGTIAGGGVADFLIVADRGASPADTLAELRSNDIVAVVVGGQPQLITEELANRWPAPLHGMEALSVAGVRRFVHAPVAELMGAAREFVGPELRLAGKLVTA